MKILAIGSHCDDVELGCGATLSKLSENNDVIIYALSDCGVPGISQEFKNSTKELGCLCEIGRFDRRTFDSRRQDILDQFISMRAKLKPDLVFVHSSTDIHTDHWTVHREAVKAFKHCKILGYECIWNNIQQTNHTFFSEIEDHHLRAKLLALESYKSQENRQYMNPEFITSLAKVRGVQAGVHYAESFETIRWYL